MDHIYSTKRRQPLELLPYHQRIKMPSVMSPGPISGHSHHSSRAMALMLIWVHNSNSHRCTGDNGAREDEAGAWVVKEGADEQTKAAMTRLHEHNNIIGMRNQEVQRKRRAGPTRRQGPVQRRPRWPDIAKGVMASDQTKTWTRQVIMKWVI